MKIFLQFVHLLEQKLESDFYPVEW